MKRVFLILTLSSTMLLSACGADEKTIDGVAYGTYGVVNKEEMRNPDIHYEISGWSIAWSVIFCQTIIVPVYFIGWDLYQPVTKKDANWVPGQVK